MNYTIGRRVAGILAVGLLLALAGCGDSGGSDTATAEPDAGTETMAEMTEATEASGMTDSEMGTATPETTDSGMGTATEGPMMTDAGTDSSVEVVEIPSYEYSENESYTYETTLRPQQSQMVNTTETWEVTSVEGDQVTVERQTVIRGNTTTQTITGNQSNIHDEVADARRFSYFTVARAPLRVTQMGDMTAGNNFTVRPGQFPNPENIRWEQATVEVNGEQTVNGVTCTEFTLKPEGMDQVQTLCVNEDYPFAVSVSLDQQGRTVLEMTLTESNRP